MTQVSGDRSADALIRAFLKIRQVIARRTELRLLLDLALVPAGPLMAEMKYFRVKDFAQDFQ